MWFLWLSAWATAFAGAGSAEPDTPAAPLAACHDAASSDLVDWAKARTVRIEAKGDTVGSGVLISADGFLLTAAHVVEGAVEVEVIDSGGHARTGTVVRREDDADLALVRLDEQGLPCMPVRSDPERVGSDVHVIGSPGGQAFTHTVVRGIISAYRDIEGLTVLQTDASISPGSSGGPIIGPTGELLGIVSFKVSGLGFEGLGFGVAAGAIPDILEFGWGDETHPSWLDATPAAVTRVSIDDLMPVLEPGPGVSYNTDMRYQRKYRPRAGHLVWGGALVASGAFLVGKSWMASQADEPIAESDWNRMVLTNYAGWTLLATGGLGVGLGLALPSKRAPVVAERSEEVR